jgi:hypothetical protein
VRSIALPTGVSSVQDIPIRVGEAAAPLPIALDLGPPGRDELADDVPDANVLGPPESE